MKDRNGQKDDFLCLYYDSRTIWTVFVTSGNDLKITLIEMDQVVEEFKRNMIEKKTNVLVYSEQR